MEDNYSKTYEFCETKCLYYWPGVGAGDILRKPEASSAGQHWHPTDGDKERQEIGIICLLVSRKGCITRADKGGQWESFREFRGKPEVTWHSGEESISRESDWWEMSLTFREDLWNQRSIHLQLPDFWCRIGWQERRLERKMFLIENSGQDLLTIMEPRSTQPTHLCLLPLRWEDLGFPLPPLRDTAEVRQKASGLNVGSGPGL